MPAIRRRIPQNGDRGGHPDSSPENEKSHGPNPGSARDRQPRPHAAPGGRWCPVGRSPVSGTPANLRPLLPRRRPREDPGRTLRPPGRLASGSPPKPPMGPPAICASEGAYPRRLVIGPFVSWQSSSHDFLGCKTIPQEADLAYSDRRRFLCRNFGRSVIGICPTGCRGEGRRSVEGDVFLRARKGEILGVEGWQIPVSPCPGDGRPARSGQCGGLGRVCAGARAPGGARRRHTP